MEITRDRLPEFAREVLAGIDRHERGAFVVFLQGELGAGKTTFMQHFAKELGITDAVQSPTYVLMKSYPIDWNGFTALVHIDAYRLEDGAEFGALKPDSFLKDTGVLVCIEWPEKVASALPKADITLEFRALAAADARDITTG